MKIEIVRENELTEDQRVDLRKRLAGDAAREGLFDHWEDSTPSLKFYVVLLNPSRAPIGMLSCTDSKDATIPSWWVDPAYRGKGLGHRIIDTFAEKLKQEGVTGIGHISFTGVYVNASYKLAKSLKAHFP
jgi:ribosomal protein S18 acetylase RimI-like enzyme